MARYSLRFFVDRDEKLGRSIAPDSTSSSRGIRVSAAFAGRSSPRDVCARTVEGSVNRLSALPRCRRSPEIIGSLWCTATEVRPPMTATAMQSSHDITFVLADLFKEFIADDSAAKGLVETSSQAIKSYTARASDHRLSLVHPSETTKHQDSAPI